MHRMPRKSGACEAQRGAAKQLHRLPYAASRARPTSEVYEPLDRHIQERGGATALAAAEAAG